MIVHHESRVNRATLADKAQGSTRGPPVRYPWPVRHRSHHAPNALASAAPYPVRRTRRPSIFARFPHGEREAAFFRQSDPRLSHGRCLSPANRAHSVHPRPPAGLCATQFPASLSRRENLARSSGFGWSQKVVAATDAWLVRRSDTPCEGARDSPQPAAALCADPRRPATRSPSWNATRGQQIFDRRAGACGPGWIATPEDRRSRS